MCDKSPQTDHLHWLLKSLALEAAIFHAGRYCGAWQASTHGKLLSSFHLVLEGQCWLHRPGMASTALQEGDCVLFIKDVPHQLSHEAHAHTQTVHNPMQPLLPNGPQGTGLACGFFHFRGELSHLLLDNLPDVIVVKKSDTSNAAMHKIFDLIRMEAQGDPEAPSALLSKLVEVLFFYAMREVVTPEKAGMLGIWGLVHHPRMGQLLQNVLENPAQEWTVDAMAEHVHMSRSNFIRHFTELTGQSPAGFLTVLRMRIAASRLESGDSIERAADHVGYRSSASFSRAFKKVTGSQPGAWRKTGQFAPSAERFSFT